ncbi:MAG: aspartate aminotransferase family protein, partial [Actinomycetota bacterium]|nr:aspartate aminotransferase family protein [Actinomycetota bacterium]
MHRFAQPLSRPDIDAVLAYAAERLSLDPAPLDGPLSSAELREDVVVTITDAVMGAAGALDVFY